MNFKELGAHWTGSPAGIAITKGSAYTLVLVKRGTKQTLVTQTVPNPQRYENIRVAVDISLHDVSAGANWWRQAGVILLGFDKNKTRMAYWPYKVALISGTKAWAAYELVVPIATQMERLQLFLFHGGETGRVLMKNLRVDAVSERVWFYSAKFLLIGFWIALGLWVLVPLLVQRRNSVVAHLTFLVFISMLGGALMPQPELSQFVRPTLNVLTNLAKATRGAKEDRDTKTNVTQKAQKKAAQPADKPTAQSEKPLHPQPAALPVRFEGDHGQYTLHFLSHVALGFLVTFAFRGTPPWKLFAYLILAATVTELAQIFVITRSAGIGDGLANMAGAATGLVLYAALHRCIKLLPTSGQNNTI